MKKKLVSIIALIIFIFLGSGVFSLIMPQNALAAGTSCPDTAFLGFKTWYAGLQDSGDCSVQPDPGTDGLKKFVTQVIMNILDIVFMAFGYMAFFFILFGGFQFIISQGNADKMAKARNTIMNAVIGIVIAVSAVAIVRYALDGLIGAGVSSSENVQVVDVLNGALNIFYFITGAVAMITMIISGFTMITVGSKADSVAKARNSIMYAAIGIVVIVAAKGITWFILGKF